MPEQAQESLQVQMPVLQQQGPALLPELVQAQELPPKQSVRLQCRLRHPILLNIGFR